MELHKVTEYKDSKGEHRITATANNGNKTYASTEGYKNIGDARETAIKSALSILDHYGIERDMYIKFCDFLEENGRPIDYSLIDEYLKGK